MFEGKDRRVQLWVLRSHESLNNIKLLLSYQHSEFIDKTDVPLYYKWVPSNGIARTDKFEINEIIIDGQKIKYLPVYAEIDFMRVKKDDVSRTPREVAIGTHCASILFIETNGPIKILVSSSGNYFTKVRTKLLKNAQESWGEISYKDLKLEREFFYWLMSKKGKKLRLGREVYILSDLDAFDCATERTQHQYTGSGKGIGQEVPVGTMVGLSNLFTGLGVRLENGSNVQRFSLYYNFETVISFMDSHKFVNDNIDYFNTTELVLKIYFQIIPGVIKAYNSQRETWPQDEIEFRRYVTVRAIKELMLETGLTIDDVDKHIEAQKTN